MTISRTLAALAGTILLATSPAMAAGSHSGGHGHDTAGFGKAGEAKKATRTVEITMGDNYFEPETITVRPGETVRFVLINKGDFLHEFGFGTDATIPPHQEMMAMMMQHGMISETAIDQKMMNMPMEGMHAHMHGPDSANVMVEPGKTAEMVWTFNTVPDLQIACTLPGHYESGMAGRVVFSTDISAN